MRRPAVPSASVLDARRIRDVLTDIMRWFDAGTRTLDLPSGTIEDDDVTEFVKPDGTRYQVTAAELKTYVNAP